MKAHRRLVHVKFILLWIVDEMRLNMLRTVPTVLIFAFGMSALISAFSLLKGLESQEQVILERFGANNLVIEYAIETEDWIRSYSESTDRLNRTDLTSLTEGINGIESGAILQEYIPSELLIDGSSSSARILVIECDFFSVFHSLRELFSLTQHCRNWPPGTLLVGPEVVDSTGSPQSSYQVNIQVDGIFFKGGDGRFKLFALGSEYIRRSQYSDYILISKDTFETRLMPFTNTVTEKMIWLRAEPDQLNSSLIREVVAKLRYRHTDDSQFTISTADQLINIQSQSAQRFLYILFGVSLLLIIGSMVALLNSTLASLKKRYVDFGLLRALGLSKYDICQILAGEALFIALVGSCAGLLMGLVLSGLISNAYNVSYQFGGLFAAVSVLGFCLAAVISTLIPMHRVFRNDPAYALRD